METVRPWSGGFGIEIDAPGRPLADVDIDELRGQVLEHGLVLLRQWEVDVDSLQSLNDRLYDRPLVYGGAREQVSDDDTIQTVDLGLEHLGLHVELGYVPVRPDLAVFHCEVPASSGGETTFGDGAAVFASLSPSTQTLLSENRIRYHTVVRSVTWQRMFKIDSQEEILAIGATLPNTEAEFDDEGDLHIDFVVPAVFERRGTTVFADSVHRFGAELEPEWVQGLKKTGTRLEHGPLDEEVRAEIVRACDQAETPIGWQPGDVVVIDNWSVLHGRTAFTDRNRRILASFGYAAWARPEPALAA